MNESLFAASDRPDHPVDEPPVFEPADGYELPVALMHNGAKQTHIVDTRTFEQHRVINQKEGGYYANVGQADALCGRDCGGRMTPVDEGDATVRSKMCTTCLRALEAREASSTGGGDDA